MTRCVLVPTSIVRETDDKRAATLKLGYVARAAAVFGIDRLGVFPDPEGTGKLDGGFVDTVLRYAATPPYLKTEVWGTRDELEYVGVLPPLRVSSRTGSGPERPGSLQEGIVTEVGPDGRVRVNCGLQHPISLLLPDGMEASEGERVAIRISSREPVRARIVDEPLPGFQIQRADLPEVLARPDAGLRIATSVHGTSLSVDRLTGLVGRIDDAGDLTVAFGAPGRGLPAILDVAVEDVAARGGEGVEPDPGFDLWLNTIPRQGSETVRTEEAMFASLAPLTLTE